jgi:hypothetical protein
MQQMMISQSVERLSIANTSLLIHIVPSPSPTENLLSLDGNRAISMPAKHGKESRKNLFLGRRAV